MQQKRKRWLKVTAKSRWEHCHSPLLLLSREKGVAYQQGELDSK